MEADKATIGREEEICVGTSQAGEGIEGSTVYSHKDWRGEARLREELDPVDIVVIGHALLNYPSPLHSFAPFILERQLRKWLYRHINKRRS
jgi:hypothetical protein